MSNTQRLRSLLIAAKEEQRLTLDKVVANSRGRVGRSSAGNLTKELHRAHPLTREELADIAQGFGVDYEVLRQAHLLDMGLLTQDEDTDEAAIALPAGMHRLTERQRAAINAVVRAMLEPLDADERAEAAAVAQVRENYERAVMGPMADAEVERMRRNE